MPARPGLGNRDPEKLSFLPRATQQEGTGTRHRDARLSPRLFCQVPTFFMH